MSKPKFFGGGVGRGRGAALGRGLGVAVGAALTVGDGASSNGVRSLRLPPASASFAAGTAVAGGAVAAPALGLAVAAAPASASAALRRVSSFEPKYAPANAESPSTTMITGRVGNTDFFGRGCSALGSPLRRVSPRGACARAGFASASALACFSCAIACALAVAFTIVSTSRSESGFICGCRGALISGDDPAAGGSA